MNMDVVEVLILPAFGALAGVVTALWRQITNTHKTTQEKLDDCEEQGKETTKSLIELTGKVGRLEGRQDGIESLAKSVLEVVGRTDDK